MELGELCCEPIPYSDWMAKGGFTPCCYEYVKTRTGCTDECHHADGLSGEWHWHGSANGWPTPENVSWDMNDDQHYRCPTCTGIIINLGGDYFDRVHAMMRGELLPEDFDEEAERARLVAVDR